MAAVKSNHKYTHWYKTQIHYFTVLRGVYMCVSVNQAFWFNQKECSIPSVSWDYQETFHRLNKSWKTKDSDGVWTDQGVSEGNPAKRCSWDKSDGSGKKPLEGTSRLEVRACWWEYWSHLLVYFLSKQFLLRWDSLNIKLTILNLTIRCHIVHSQCCAIITSM